MNLRFSLLVLLTHCLATGLVLADEIRIAGEKVIVSGPTLSQPRVAFGNGIYLVVWQEGWAGVDATADIRGLRLRADTLEPLDREPLAICIAPEAQEAPAVAWADGIFLVAWQDFRSGKNHGVNWIPIDAGSGTSLREKGRFPAPENRNQLRPALASAGKTFCLVWQEIGDQDRYGIRGLRLARDGQPLDGQAHEYTVSGTSPAVSVSGNRLLVTWANRDRNQATTSAALVDTVTGKKIKDLGKINTCCGDAPVCAGDGAGNFITAAGRASNPDPWGWGGPGAVVLSRVQADGSTPESKLNYASRLSNLCSRSVPNVVDAAVWKGSKTWDAGAVGGFPGTQDGLWPTGAPAVVHAGHGLHLFAWVKGTLNKDKLTVANFDVWLRGMDAQSLAVRIPDQKVAGNTSADESQPGLTPGPSGEILLSYLRLQPGENRRIVVRRLTVTGKAK